MARERLSIKGPQGRLDARVEGHPEGVPVVFLHPHPRAGGTMGSRLVYDLATGLAADGYCTYRFDFRGVGRSEGAYGDGIGETNDALAVFDAVEARHAVAPVLIGHSFGAAVAIRVAARRPAPRLIVLGTPTQVSMSRLVPLDDAPDVTVPVHLIVGDRDEYVDEPSARLLAKAFSGPASLTILEDAGHFLEPSANPRVLDLVRKILRGG